MTDKMDEYRVEMKRIDKMHGDSEIQHGWADDLMLKVVRDAGFDEVADWFKKLEKWYA